MNRILTTAAVFAFAAGLSACGGGETAATGPVDEAAKEVIEARQENLKDLGASFKTINDQVKLPAPDMAAIGTAASAISGHAAAIGAWFPAGSGPEANVKTEALPVIWADAAGFAAAVERLQSGAGTMSEAAATGDAATVGAAIPVLGGACKNCHDNYRLQTN